MPRKPAVGNEGMVGTSIFMGADSTPGRAIVKRSGLSFRLKSKIIKEEFYRAGPLMRLLLRYTQALIAQTSQTAVCNRHHSIDQQVCRRLLISLDHTQSGEVLMTQELMATILGIRREGVTESARRLQHAGLIRYVRGRIMVLDRRGLEQRSCECYVVIKRNTIDCSPGNLRNRWRAYAMSRAAQGSQDADEFSQQRPPSGG